jgi:hypothetical protein
MEAALRDALRRFRAGEPPPVPRPEVVRRYEYRRLARELADVFDGVRGERATASSGMRRLGERGRAIKAGR